MKHQEDMLTEKEAANELWQHYAIDATWVGDGSEHLYVLLEEERCQFAIYQPGKQKFVAAGKSRNLGEGVLQKLANSKKLEEQLPQSEYERCYIGHESESIALVPSVLYKDDQRDKIFGLTHGEGDKMRVLKTSMQTLEAELLYAIPKAHYFQLTASYANYRQVSTVAADLLAQQIWNKQNPNVKILFVGIRSSHIQVLAWENGELKLCNAYKAETTADKLYFTLFVAEQLGMNPMQDELVLQGDFERNGEVEKLLSQYWKNTKVQQRPDGFHFALPLLQLPQHEFATIFSFPLCES